MPVWTVLPIVNNLAMYRFLGLSILHDIGADWGLEDDWQGVGVLAGLAIAAMDGNGRSARHFGGCRVVFV